MPTYTPTAIATTGSVLTASEFNKLPRGVLSYVENASLSQSASTSGTDITSLTTGSVTIAANRLLRVTVYIPSIERNGAMSLAVRIVEDSSNVQYGRWDSNNIVTPCSVVAFRSGVSAGAHTWKAQVVITAGAGTWTASSNSATGAAFIMLEDVGSA